MHAVGNTNEWSVCPYIVQKPWEKAPWIEPQCFWSSKFQDSGWKKCCAFSVCLLALTPHSLIKEVLLKLSFWPEKFLPPTPPFLNFYSRSHKESWKDNVILWVFYGVFVILQFCIYTLAAERRKEVSVMITVIIVILPRIPPTGASCFCHLWQPLLSLHPAGPFFSPSVQLTPVTLIRHVFSHLSRFKYCSLFLCLLRLMSIISQVTACNTLDFFFS